MLENVTDIIVARSREPEGLKTMIVWSVAAHIALAVLAMTWGGPRLDTAPRQVMNISLSGAPGPKTGGQTQIGQGLSHATVYTTAIPEPETYALLMAGLAFVGWASRRRQRRQ